MNRHRFYVPAAATSGGPVTIDGAEAHHLAGVLRITVGASIQIFDGQGHEFVARVEHVDPGAVIVRPLEAVDAVPEPSIRLTLAQALLKGRAGDAVVRDATMLGVAVIQPVLTTHVDRPLGGGRGIEARWRRVAVASAKQCGRAVVPVVRPPIAFQTLVVDTPPPVIVLVEPARERPALAFHALASRPRPTAALIVVGPEGGWSDEEIEMAVTRGATPVTLGPRTLRAEAAPLVAIAVLQHVWGDLA